MEKIHPNLKVDPRNARAEGYKQIMEDIVDKNECPLCPLLRWHPNPILKDDGRWFITRNSHPYPNTEHHFLLVCKRHIEILEDLTIEDLTSFLSLTNWATQEFNIKGGGLTMRFGDTLYTGATIKHIHGHLIIPKVTDGKPQPVYFPIG